MSLKRNLFHLLLYNSSTLLTIGVTFLVITPIATRELTEDEFGVVKTLQTFSGVLLIFFSMSIAAAFTRFYYDHRGNHQELARLTSTCFLFLLFVDLALILPAFAAGRVFLRIVDVEPSRYTLILLVLLPLSNMLSSLATISITYLNQIKHNVAINIVTVIATLLSAATTLLCLLGLGVKEESFFWAALVAGLITGGFGLYVLRRYDLLAWSFSLEMLRPVLKFALASLPFSMCAWVWLAADHVILAAYEGVALTGKYAIAYGLAMVLQKVYNQFWRVGNPYLLSYLKDHDAKEREHLLRLMDVYYLMLMACGLFLIYFGQRVLNVLIPENYQLDQWVLTMCVLSFIFLGLRKYTDSIIWFHKKLMLMFVFAGLAPALLNLVLNLLLIPIYLEYAAALSSLVTSVAVLGISIYLSRRFEPIPYKAGTSLRLLVIMLTGLAVNAALVLSGRDRLVISVPVYVILLGLAFHAAGGIELVREYRQARQKRNSAETPHP